MFPGSRGAAIGVPLDRDGLGPSTELLGVATSPSPSRSGDDREEVISLTYVPVCDYDGHFWPKKKSLYYVAIGVGADFLRYRRRFCAHHVASVDEDLAEHEVLVPERAESSSYASMANCFSCGQPVSQGGTQVFITGYPTQDQRKDYWGKLHPGHLLPMYLRDEMVP